MNENDIHALVKCGLADLAQHAQPVDLAETTFRRVRQIQVYRLLAAACLIVFLAVGGSVAMAAVGAGSDRKPVAPATTAQRSTSSIVTESHSATQYASTVHSQSPSGIERSR